MKSPLNLPNQITIARLILAIVFFVLLAQYSQRTPEPWKLDWACALFIVAAATDFLDGYIARKWGMVTKLGRVLDPLVDKVLICGAFIFFVGPGFVDTTGTNATEVQAWMVVVIVCRELLVTGLRGFSESVGRNFSAGLHGKLKMWIQSIAVPVILFIVAHEESWKIGSASTIKATLAWVTAIVTALSALQYLARSRHILDESAS